MSTKIRVAGFSRLDVLELRGEFPGLEIDFENSAGAGPSHGELATIAVVTVSLAALRVVASWLVKDRKTTTFTKEVEVEDAQGNRRRERITLDLSSSLAPEKDVLDSLASITSIDLKKMSAGSDAT